MKRSISLITLAAFSLLVSACSAQRTAEDKAPAKVNIPENMQTAVVGAGCFWCVESFFEHLEGVQDAVSGYAGGVEKAPTYYQVARGETSHAEVVQVIYDANIISYRELVDFFWTTHDATRDDGVWPDFGTQYRSILLYQNDEEKDIIEASRKAYEVKTHKKIATDIKALDVFYPAETYHQDYAKKNPSDRYVQGILNPKLKKLGFK
ncbi:MAG: peptide-methionine (S)-S-oxide reductase MsrA [Opitutaceae bacterium]